MTGQRTNKVFLDIGGHLGETLTIVQDPVWGFDRIFCFEPAPVCWPALESLAGPRTQVCRFGLWSHDTTMVLHNPGGIGASVFGDKEEVVDTTACEFRDVAAWMRDNLDGSEVVFAKINIEGAEADLIARMDESGVLAWIDHLLVHFDVRKVPSQRFREAAVRRRLIDAGIEFQAAEDIQFGIVPRGTVNWLAWCHGRLGWRWARHKVIARVEFAGRRLLYPLKIRMGSR